MANIWCLCPSDFEGYLHILEQVVPILDEAGVSFCVIRPDEDIARLILKSEGRKFTAGQETSVKGVKK